MVATPRFQTSASASVQCSNQCTECLPTKPDICTACAPGFVIWGTNCVSNKISMIVKFDNSAGANDYMFVKGGRGQLSQWRADGKYSTNMRGDDNALTCDGKTMAEFNPINTRFEN